MSAAARLVAPSAAGQAPHARLVRMVMEDHVWMLAKPYLGL